MRDHKEVTDNIWRKTEQYEAETTAKKARRRRLLPKIAAAAAVCVVGVIVWKVAGGGRVGTTPTGYAVTVTVTPVLTEPGNRQDPAKPTTEPDWRNGAKELTAALSSAAAPNGKPMDEAMRTAYEAFACKLFAGLPAEGTRMVSPFSVYTALCMLANGADGDTLAQMDAMLGLTEEERNAYLSTWVSKLTGGSDEGATFTNANSIWIKNTFESSVPKDFLNTCARYYRSAVYSAPFTKETVDAINGWVKTNTKDMIEKLIDELDPQAVMFLLNAIAFDAKWEEEFSEDRTQKDYTFIKENGTTENVDMMFGEFLCGFLHSDLATGFVKKYKGGEFSYVALLPREGVSVAQLAESLQPGALRELLATAEIDKVNIGIPKYEAEYFVKLNDVLKQMGMTDAFDVSKADLSRLLTEQETYVNRVLHKTFISVDEKGTKAAAVTGIEVNTESAPAGVILDRTFVYAIVDSEGLPIFLGVYDGKPVPTGR